MRIYSWNVNGIRAIQKKGFAEWVRDEQPDILCLQETKIHASQLDGLNLDLEGYHAYFSCGERKGYSGVATYTKEEPLSVAYGIGIEQFDNEGRIMVTEYPSFTLLNIYFPNGQMGEERLTYKLEFYDAIIEYCAQLRKQGKKLIVCGDYNTAHQEIDLKNPKANENYSGFLPIEREKLSEFLARGYIDTFRHLYPQEVKYSWWSYRFRARERGVGWRIDYHCVSDDLLPQVKDALILDQVMGSDHCPVVLHLDN
jgi:exodeoxyribonuclease-3